MLFPADIYSQPEMPLLSDDLQQYMRPVMMTLLTRMQTSKTATYEYLFARFILYCMAVNVDGLGPDYMINVIEGIQPQLVYYLTLW